MYSLNFMVDQQKPPKISNVTAVLMVSVALFFDLIIGLVSLINFILPPLGAILSAPVIILGYATIYLWFMIKGVKLMTGKKLAAMGLGPVIALIPILPGVTTSTVLTIIFDRKEGLPLAGAISRKVG